MIATSKGIIEIPVSNTVTNFEGEVRDPPLYKPREQIGCVNCGYYVHPTTRHCYGCGWNHALLLKCPPIRNPW